jgi:hypothetical protein
MRRGVKVLFSILRSTPSPVPLDPEGDPEEGPDGDPDGGEPGAPSPDDPELFDGSAPLGVELKSGLRRDESLEDESAFPD